MASYTVSFRFVAQKHELVDIAPFLQDFVRANFTAIVRTHRFLGMELQQLRDFLSDDGIMVRYTFLCLCQECCFSHWGLWGGILQVRGLFSGCS